MTAEARCFDLSFAADRHGRSFLGAQYVRYPVHVCRALHDEQAPPGACRLALQSVSGGLFEGDRVAGRVQAGAGARATVTTSASTIVHRMRGGGEAEQSVELVTRGNARLCWLPEPMILFPGSRLRSRTRVQADPASTLMLCESFLAHDPTGKGGSFEGLDAQFDVVDPDGRLRVRERLRIDGAAWQARRLGVSGRHGVHGSLWLLRRGDLGPLLHELRALLAGEPLLAGGSELPDGCGLQLRLLAPDAVSLRRGFDLLQARIREALDLSPAAARPSPEPAPA